MKHSAKPEETPDVNWLRFFAVNVLSGVRLARIVANWGRIISSERAVQIRAEMFCYGMTKTAQIAVNSVLTGPTNSHEVRAFVETGAIKDGEVFARSIF